MARSRAMATAVVVAALGGAIVAASLFGTSSAASAGVVGGGVIAILGLAVAAVMSANARLADPQDHQPWTYDLTLGRAVVVGSVYVLVGVVFGLARGMSWPSALRQGVANLIGVAAVVLVMTWFARRRRRIRGKRSTH